MYRLNEKNDYTNLNDLEDAVTRACENGGVSIEGVLPLHFELDTVPPAADIPETTATNTMKLDDGTTKASLTFTTVNAGEYANNYTINLRYSKECRRHNGKVVGQRSYDKRLPRCYGSRHTGGCRQGGRQ